MPTETDRIEKTVLINAPVAKVWRALADAQEFGKWFKVSLPGQTFEAGKPARGQITYPGYEHLKFEVTVERVEPEKLLSMRWHPYAIDPAKDYSKEPTTLIVFTLTPEGAGTRLTVVESGFDNIPAERRAEAFRMNSGGWEAQMGNIKTHVEA